MARIFWPIPHLTGFPRLLEPTSGLDFQAQGPPFCLDVHFFKGPKWKQLTDNKKDVTFLIIWLTVAPWISKINQILHCDWLPEQARWSYLARSGLPAVSCKKNFPESRIINPFIGQACSVKMAGYWPHSCKFIGLHSILVHKHTEKELG